MKNQDQRSILTLILAREGSKGLPGKNIKPLLGKPLIAWTIEQAKQSTYVERLVVSTDSPEIAEIAKKYGAEVPFLRPAALAQDDSPGMDVILHAIDFFEKRGEYFDILVILELTSPLRKKDDIDRAISLFHEYFERADSLVSVGEVHVETPYIMQKIEDGYVKLFLRTDQNIYVRQELSKAYFPYGVIYISKVDALKKYKTFYQDRTIPYFIERWQNYEIDDIWDFLCVEAILKSTQGDNQ